jgi:hypothetical protein
MRIPKGVRDNLRFLSEAEAFRVPVKAIFIG